MNGPPRKGGKLVACGTCPWRVSTKTEQIPGGGMDHGRSADCLDQGLTAMACHLSTDQEPVACAGFVQAQKGADDGQNIGYRLAIIRGLLDPDDYGEDGGQLHPTLREMLAAHPPSEE